MAAAESDGFRRNFLHRRVVGHAKLHAAAFRHHRAFPDLPLAALHLHRLFVCPPQADGKPRRLARARCRQRDAGRNLEQPLLPRPARPRPRPYFIVRHDGGGVRAAIPHGGTLAVCGRILRAGLRRRLRACHADAETATGSVYPASGVFCPVAAVPHTRRSALL